MILVSKKDKKESWHKISAIQKLGISFFKTKEIKGI
jgi:hypothetical protein